MSDRVLDVKNLSIDIPLAEGMLHAVDGIDIYVDKGETLCIVGESGCGKSLTSLAVMDLLPKKAIRRLERLDLAGASILDYSERQMSDIRGSKMGMTTIGAVDRPAASAWSRLARPGLREFQAQLREARLAASRGKLQATSCKVAKSQSYKAYQVQGCKVTTLRDTRYRRSSRHRAASPFCGISGSI